MEYEVFVPVPVERLREALADPARVARAVPGLQQDAAAEPVTARLKVRFGSHSVTYRGVVRLSALDADAYAIEGDAVEARGTGTVKLSLTVHLHPTPDGTTVKLDGTATADGRVTELRPETVTSATIRLLNRFVEALAEAPTAGEPAEAKSGEGTEGDPGRVPEPGGESQPEPEAEADSEAEPESEAERESEAEPERTPEAEAEPTGEAGAPQADGADGGVDEPAAADGESAPQGPPPPDDESGTGGAGGKHEPGDGEAEPHASVFDAEIPPPSLDPTADDEEPPAEAAHARRTMIGRSAEEVDHAPPRGRYAPVPAPQTIAAGSTLRWAAPAAALVVASAIIVGRALRKRR
ncbi:SRPBCC domain-containing protein [Streptomyces sp. NPDC001984]